jgi:hypothetical protein
VETEDDLSIARCKDGELHFDGLFKLAFEEGAAAHRPTHPTVAAATAAAFSPAFCPAFLPPTSPYSSAAALPPSPLDPVDAGGHGVLPPRHLHSHLLDPCRPLVLDP